MEDRGDRTHIIPNYGGEGCWLLPTLSTRVRIRNAINGDIIMINAAAVWVSGRLSVCK